MSGPILAVGAVVVVDDRLLMVRRGRGPAAGLWSVPGGRVEWGETMAEAVVRELAEETGLAGACGEVLGWVERLDDDDHFVIVDHRVTLLGADDAVAGDDAAEVAWVPLAEIGEWRLVDGLAEFLHEQGLLRTIT